MNLFVFALGVFVGNWLVVSLVFKDKTRKEGFFIGLIAAILVLGFAYLTSWFI